MEPTWWGLLDRSDFNQEAAAALDASADAAKRGDWAEVLRLLDDDAGWVSANSWRPGGSSWFTPLHQAAWHGVSREVVDALLERGAWRTLRTAEGETAQDVARRRGHVELAEYLEPRQVRVVAPGVLPRLDEQLRALVDARIQAELRVRLRLRYPSTSVLTELDDGWLWFPVPGMYGGFRIELMRSYLYVSSWSRMVGGSGQAHVVTAEGYLLVEEGFV